jgi:hypothetical protein
MKLARFVLLIQATYFIGTGLWPVLHLSSFLAVTGPKVDLWLVQAFGLLVLAQGAALLFTYVARRELEALPFGLCSAAMLALVDIWFVTRGDIGPVYLLDAGVDTLLVAGWLIARVRRTPDQS